MSPVARPTHRQRRVGAADSMRAPTDMVDARLVCFAHLGLEVHWRAFARAGAVVTSVTGRRAWFGVATEMKGADPN